MDLRDTLLADVPLGAWVPSAHPLAALSPGRELVQAERAIVAGDSERAATLLMEVAHTPGLDSREYLVVWRTLRSLGVEPAPLVAKQVLGVVLEVSFEHGLDLLAAYSSYSARYYNYSGAGIVWDAFDTRLDREIEAVVSAGRRIAELVARSTKPMPAPPKPSLVRVNVLTPGGLHFGQGEMAALEADTLFAPALAAGLALMESLVAEARSER